MTSVVTMGELLIDFGAAQSGIALAEAETFAKAPGGAPANVAVGLARLGVSSAFLGKVGDDSFGHFLADTLKKEGVSIEGLRFSKDARTMLAFVSLRADGEREFEFFRHPSADMLYTPGDVAQHIIRSARIFHFGSISLISEPARSATRFAINTARDAGILISYDPNLRLNLWPGAESARDGIRSAWPLAQVIKVSEEEVVFLSGTANITKGVGELWHPDLRLLVVTLGKAGCMYFTPGTSGVVPGFNVKVVDTTGAGDGFVAGLLKGLLDDAGVFSVLSHDDVQRRLEAVCRYANAVGALTTTQRGAIPALPLSGRVDSFLRGRQQTRS